MDTVEWLLSSRSKSFGRMSLFNLNFTCLAIRGTLPPSDPSCMVSLTCNAPHAQDSCNTDEVTIRLFVDCVFVQRCGQDARVFVEGHPEQLCKRGLRSADFSKKYIYKNKPQVLLEDHQRRERNTLVCRKLVGVLV